MARTNTQLTTTDYIMISWLSSVANDSVLYKNNSWVYTWLLLNTFVQTTWNQNVWWLKTFTSSIITSLITVTNWINHFLLKNGTLNRFWIVLNLDESTWNIWSDFRINTYDDAWNYLWNSFNIRRSNWYVWILTTVPWSALEVAWTIRATTNFTPTTWKWIEVLFNSGTNLWTIYSINRWSFAYYDLNFNDLVTITANNRVWIWSGTATASARLQVDSTSQWFLPPRMTTTQKNAIWTPATWLVIFDTTLGKLCVFSTTWQTVTSL